jgi:hypothetical protein
MLSGTIGQPDAGVVMSGGEYTLSGGFWPGTFGCVVNFYDHATFSKQWLEAGSNLTADLNHSKIVDFNDYATFADNWLECCPADWPLKE